MPRAYTSTRTIFPHGTIHYFGDNPVHIYRVMLPRQYFKDIADAKAKEDVGALVIPPLLLAGDISKTVFSGICSLIRQSIALFPKLDEAENIRVLLV